MMKMTDWTNKRPDTADCAPFAFNHDAPSAVTVDISGQGSLLVP
jgi:hypothetical protein